MNHLCCIGVVAEISEADISKQLKLKLFAGNHLCPFCILTAIILQQHKQSKLCNIDTYFCVEANVNSLLTSLTSIPLLTDHVVWKHSSMRCSMALGSRWTLMKSFRSLVRVWYSERREYILWMIAVTLPNTTACISAGHREKVVCFQYDTD